MSATEEILAGINPQQLAAALGTDEATAMNAAATAIPTLIGSLQANATSPEGSQGLLTALDQHAEGYGETVDLDQVDTADGQKILAHALADDPQRLQAVSGLGGDLLSKLLPLLAPIVMSYLARKLGRAGSNAQQGGSGNVLGDLLGGLLGGAGGSAAGGGLGDLLGGLLGGGQPAGAPAAGTPASPTGYAPAPGSGGVFNAPEGGPGGLQIPQEDTQDSSSQSGQQQQPQGSGDLLGGLLGKILGR